MGTTLFAREPEAAKPRSKAMPPDGSCDDWLRELFSGTYDLREAENIRRSENGHRPAVRPKAERDER
jgi:hypothetical protein